LRKIAVVAGSTLNASVAVREHRGIAGVEDEALLGEADRRRDQVGALHRPVLGERHVEARDRAGDADGEVAGRRRSLDDVAGGVEVHVGGRGERRLLAEVEEGFPAVAELQRHEAAAAEVACRRVHDRQRIADGDRRVDRVAAAAQDIDPDLGGEALRADDHAVLCGDRRHRGGCGRRRANQRPRRSRPTVARQRHVGAQFDHLLIEGSS
jgi:hypothetical protein